MFARRRGNHGYWLNLGTLHHFSLANISQAYFNTSSIFVIELLVSFLNVTAF